MQTAHPTTSHTHEQAMSAINGATVQRTIVNWDYPLSPAAYYNALLSRGALHSRFLRIAYLSTSERSTSPSPTPTLSPSLVSTTPSTSPTDHLAPIPPYRAHVKPRSVNPSSHSLKRRKSQWPKPPHYHASLLRSPLSRRKGLFRAVLAPNKAVDFFRWDILFGAGVSLSATLQERDRTRTGDVDACASLHVAEFVLEPYEAAAGFFGWHGLGLDVIRRVQGSCDEDVDDECCWSEGVEVRRHEDAGECRSSDLRLDIDEAVVDEGRARWARVAEELVGPPGLVLRWIVDKGKVTSDLAHQDADARAPSSISSRHEEVRWNPDIRCSSFRPSRPTSAFDEKRRPPPSSSGTTVPGSALGSKPELKADSPPAWWYGPCPTPHVPSFRFPPPPSLHYGPPPLHFSSYVPSGRATPAQGHGYWYGAQPLGAPSSTNRDPNLSRSHPPHAHSFTSPVTPTSVHPSLSLRHPTKPNLGRNEYRQGPDCDKETETDHGYESTTTTTDSDLPPHTPIGAATTSHCVEALQSHGDNEVEVHGIEIDTAHAAASVTFDLPDSTTSAKLHDRFSTSTSLSVSSDSPDSDRGAHEPFKVTVVFPSLNGSFRQGSSSQTLVSPSSLGMPRQTTPAKMATPASSSLPFAKKAFLDEGNPKMQHRDADLEAPTCSVSGDNPAFTLSLCSPPPTSPGSALRKDSQGFWEPVTPISPCSSSSSSLPLSPSEGKAGLIPTWNGEKKGESSGSSETASSQFTFTSKARSLSPSPRRVTSLDSARSSSSRPGSFSSPTSAPASTGVFGGSYPSSPSPPNNASLVPPNPTTLLPAFLATTTVKRKKASRTREIVDRLRSSSIDAGKGGVGLDSLGWLASPSAGGELDGKTTSGSDHAGGGQQSPSPPAKSISDSKPWLDLGKNHGQVSSSKTSDACPSGPGGKSNGTTASSENVSSLSTSKKTASLSITPFPILSASQTPVSDFTTTHQRQTGVTTAAPSKGGDGPKMNATVGTSPNARIPGAQLLPGTLTSGAAPSTHPSHHPLPSPSRQTVHLQPALGPPPPMVAVSTYPHPVYVPFTQYHLAPPQQAQGAWVAIYPGHPPLLPVHALPTQTHAPPITGVSGMRHVSW